MQAQLLLGLLVWGCGCGRGSATTTTEAPVGSEEWAHQVAGAARCKILFTSSYGYRQFFPLGDAASRSSKNPMDGYPAPPYPAAALIRRDPPVDMLTTSTSTAQPRTQASSKRLLLRFQVMAESDAHILMSAQRRSDREAYEVVLGAGANSYTDFRRLPASIPPRRAFNYSTGVVSGTELRAFWLLADLGTGLLAVGPVGGAPILSWIDPDPVQVRYFSLCTWTDVLGTWLYGCDESVSEPLDAEDMPPAARVFQNIVTPAKLRSPPRAPVDSNLLVSHITMDDRRGVVSLYGTIRLEWHDDRLSWSPGNFSGLNATRLSPRDVWVPSLQPLDPVGRTDPLSSGDAMRLVLQANGSLIYQFGVRLRAWCSLLSTSDYTCALRLGARPPAKLRLLTYSLTAQSSTSRSGWSLGEVRVQEQVLQLQVQHRGSRLSCVFLASYVACCLCCVMCVLRPLEHPAALSVLLQAVSLVSLHSALPPAVMLAAPAGVACLSVAMVAAACCLLCPRLLLLVAADQDSGAYALLHRCLHSPAGRLLRLRRHRERPRWREREAPSTTEEALETLTALNKEQATRDWNALSVLLCRACSLVCLAFTLAAGFTAAKL